MEALIAQIATTGNIAILVLMVGAGALYKMLREERALERQARKDDAIIGADSTNRQTAALAELTKALIELRLDAAKRNPNA